MSYCEDPDSPPCDECREWVRARFVHVPLRAPTSDLVAILDLHAEAGGHVHGGSSGRLIAEKFSRAARLLRALLLGLLLVALAGCSSELHDDVSAHGRAVVELLQVLEPRPDVSEEVLAFRLGAVRRSLRKLEDDTRPAPRPDELPVILSLPSGGGR